MLARYEARLSVSYATLSMAKLFGMMVVVSHWVACLWGLLAELEGAAAHTWLDEARAVKGAGCAEDDGARCPSLDGPVAKYAIALRSSVRLRRGASASSPTAPTGTRSRSTSRCTRSRASATATSPRRTRPSTCSRRT